MSHKSFFFIPDISGFTSFVKQVEIEHSQHIISELLELIIDSNELDLSVAEVEGDAIFFYHANRIHDSIEILSQVEKTYIAFHEHLKQYETQRICPCGACSSAVNLSLKFIADSGESQMITVKGKEKPFGESVIRVHRLLKNSISQKEYLLFTGDLVGSEKTPIEPRQWPGRICGKDEYQDLGEITYKSIPLSFLQEKVTYPPQPKAQQLTAKPLTHTIEIQANKYEVFEWLTNMDKRDLWNKDVTYFKYQKGIVNRSGYQHVCVIGNQTIGFETVTHDFGEGKLVYGEKTTEIPIFKEASSYFILEEVDEVTTIKVEFHYQEKPVLGFLFKRILFKKIFTGLKKNLKNLKYLIEIG
ncbi:MAG: DUF2652 domain-containing protein [Reichenbachiella sp.]|uniref:DUF2652 domain-containing protein n=1 Tax=Reichenbachiella sp. TaxID=2184521 RepID=UPI0032652126